MKTTTLILPSVLLLLWSTGRQTSAETAIVVSFGQHASAAIGGHGEAEVNWLDADQTDDTVCTECFAALELQHYLRRMTKRTEDFVIVNDHNVPAGDLILVGNPQSNAVSREVADLLEVSAKSVNELDTCAQAFQHGRAGQVDVAHRHLTEAKRIAELLRQDVASASLTCAPTCAANALAASNAAGALRHLEELLRNTELEAP